MLFFHHVSRKFLFSIIFLGLVFLNFSNIYSQKTFGLIKKVNGNDENGYVLFSPLNCDTTYLINKCGQKVHYWVSDYAPGMALYLLPNGHLLKSGTYTDTAFGAAGGRGGIIEEFDWDNNLIWRYKIFNDSLCQHHDIKPMPNGNVLVLAWHSISKSKAISLGRRSQTFANNQNELWGERIIELKPIGADSAEVVWQWDLFDHIVQDQDTSLPNYGFVSQHPELMNINYALTMQTADWIHANSIDYNPKLDQIIINSHNISEFWIIDHSTTMQEAASHKGGKFDKGGDLLYRWGNPQAYNMGSSQDRKLFRQHNAHWIAGGLRDSGSIMLFNNGWDRDTAYSTVEVIETPVLSNGSYVQNLPFGPSAAKWIYKDSIPKNFYSQIISGAERLPNGNTIICSGVQGLFFEVTPQKKIVWKYKNPISGTIVRSDGTNSNNSVFRASFYPSTYSAFKGKSLVGMGVLERNSQPYSCIYESVPPSVVSVLPANNATRVSIDSTLHIKMSEAVLRYNANITIYVDGFQFETINTNSDLVKYNNKDISIKHARKFPYNARVCVKVPVKFARDSSFNYTIAGIDTLQWHFNTEKSAPYITYISPDSSAMHVSTDPKPYLLFNTKVKKAAGGGFTIYENGSVKEFIPIASNRIKISGNVVELLNTKFNYSKTVIITADTCLEDTMGYNMLPLAFGRWIFDVVDQPQVLTLIPGVGETDVDPKSKLKIVFDRYMRVDSVLPVEIYVNNMLYSTINLNSSEVESGGTELVITIPNGLPAHSDIAIGIPAYALKDNYNTWFQGVNSSIWTFKTGAKSSINIENTTDINLYPNPCKDIVNIESANEIVQIQLIDVYGKMYTLPLSRISDTLYNLDVAELPAGIYVICIGDKLSIKLIKL